MGGQISSLFMSLGSCFGVRQGLGIGEIYEMIIVIVWK